MMIAEMEDTMANTNHPDHDPCLTCPNCGETMRPVGDEDVLICGCFDEPVDEPDESMDGDAASALASCGMGTDEDYGGDAYDPYDCEYDCGGYDD